jgi:hypothetical protein
MEVVPPQHAVELVIGTENCDGPLWQVLPLLAKVVVHLRNVRGVTLPFVLWRASVSIVQTSCGMFPYHIKAPELPPDVAWVQQPGILAVGSHLG